MSQLTTMARPYAKAAFASARDGSALDAWSEGLGTLAALVQHEKVAAYLGAPTTSSGQQAQTLIDLVTPGTAAAESELAPEQP